MVSHGRENGVPRGVRAGSRGGARGVLLRATLACSGGTLMSDAGTCSVKKTLRPVAVFSKTDVETHTHAHTHTSTRGRGFAHHGGPADAAPRAHDLRRDRTECIDERESFLGKSTLWAGTGVEVPRQATHHVTY